MLLWLGQKEASEILMEAVENALEAGIRTRDLGGESRTVEATETVCVEIGNLIRKNEK
jgi:isocitrate/isopropylmalate dehydrogenase